MTFFGIMRQNFKSPFFTLKIFRRESRLIQILQLDKFKYLQGDSIQQLVVIFL